MLKQDFKEFERLSEGHDLIPVYAECLADMETPVSVLNVLSATNMLLLESVEGGERFGVIPSVSIRTASLPSNIKRHIIRKRVRKELQQHDGNPLNALRQVLGGRKVAPTPGLPPLFGGALGFIGYEASAYFEVLPQPKTQPDTPDSVFMITDEVIAFDNLTHTLKVIICVRRNDYASLQEAYTDAELRAEVLVKRIQVPGRLRPEPHRPPEMPLLQSNMTKETFCNMVEKGKQYIRDGESSRSFFRSVSRHQPFHSAANLPSVAADQSIASYLLPETWRSGSRRFLPRDHGQTREWAFLRASDCRHAQTRAFRE